MDRAQLLPAAEEPRNAEPLFCKQLPGITVSKVKDALEAEPWVVIKTLEATVNGRDFNPTAWCDGTRVKNSKIRGMTFKMPPPDVPAALAKLQTLPSELSASMVFRMSSSGGSEVVMIEQTSVPEAPFGENFQALVTHCFRAYGGLDSDGTSGVNYYKWVVPVWVKEPSWVMKWVKGVIEKQVVAQMGSGDVFLQKLLECIEREQLNCGLPTKQCLISI